MHFIFKVIDGLDMELFPFIRWNLFYLLQKRPQSYLWMILGLPVLLIAHTVVMGLSWFFVISIPIAKVSKYEA